MGDKMAKCYENTDYIQNTQKLLQILQICDEN